MIDYIHFSTQIVDRQGLTDTKRSVTLSDDIGSLEIKKYLLENLKVDVSKSRTRVKGTLHKWYRGITAGDWENNHDQFTYKEVCTAIDTLCEILSTTPEECYISGFEFALNLETSFDPKEMMADSIICHRNIYDPKRHDKGESGYIILFETDNWILKIYDKGKHLGRERFIFRLEKKMIRKHKKIKTLADLKEKSTWEIMKSELLEMLNNLIIVDDPENHPIISNPLYWAKLRRKSKKDRHKFKRVFDKLPRSKYKEELYQLIESTFHNLIHHENTSSSTYQEKDKTTRIHTFYSGICDDKEVCLVTGIDISNQRKGSRFISENTIFSLPEDQFKKLEGEFLSEDKKSLDKKSQSYYIAHNIRNKFHNPRQPYRRLKAAGQLEMLFNQIAV